MDFEEYLDGKRGDYPSARQAYKAGQQSKQAQINKALELLRQPMQGTIADLLNELEDILDDT